jgi:hypothetical protein
MAKLVVLDTTRTGRHSQELENKLRSLVVGQDEAIHEVVMAYQGHVTGLSAAGRPIRNFLPGADRVGQDSHCRGNGTSPAERPAGGNQDRLRRVSARP